MAVRDAMRSAARKLIGTAPDVFFGSQGRFENEIADLANEVATDIAKYQDWQALVRVASIVGDGVDADFPLPPDYDRMLVKGRVQSADRWAWGYRHVPDTDDFLTMETRGVFSQPGVWTIYGDRLHFLPAPPSGDEAKFSYITKNWAKSNGGPKPSFTNDGDEFVLPERLLMLALVWRWRENKKLDASGDQEAFIKALDEYGASDGGSFVIRRNQRRYLPGAYPAWPGVLG